MSVRIMVAAFNGSPIEAPMMLAASWARRLGGSIVGYGIVDDSSWAPVPVLPSGDSVIVPTVPAVMAQIREDVMRSLRTLATHCQDAGVECSLIHDDGTTDEEMLIEAQRHDVLVMGKAESSDPGVGVPTRTILEKAIEHSPRPVVIVPQQSEQGRGVLVAYDGSLQAARALQALVASILAPATPTRILSIHEKSEEKAGETARRAAEYLAVHDIQTDIQLKVTQDPAEEVIIEAAKQYGAEMVVMGAYSRNRLAEFFLGSVTSRMLDKSSLPMFLFH